LTQKYNCAMRLGGALGLAIADCFIEVAVSWQRILTEGFITIESTRYDLLHLRDSIYDIVIPPSPGHNKITTKMYVRYSSHCTSIGSKGEPFDFDVLGQEYKIVDERKIERKFCATRYTLSIMLPEIFQDIMSKKCFHTARSNFLIVEYASNGRSNNYLVFFSVTKDADRLKVYVESAYLDEFGSSQRDLRAIGAKVVLAKKFRGETIKRTPLR